MTEPITLMTTNIIDLEKVSFRIGFSLMNFCFAREITDKIAETVMMATHRIGRNPPKAPPMISARILTHTVQSPLYFTGIINSMIPMMEGIRNLAISPLFLFSIIVLLLCNISKFQREPG